ncbi:MAG: 4Fe-4S binding protein [Candidatus Micrarchaeota archaeon]
MHREDSIKYMGKKGVPVITDAGNAVNLHTGLWGTLKPVVDESKCIGCRTCFTYCPVSAISWDKKKSKPIINLYFCKKCGICSNECPVKCIARVEEK